RTQSKTCLLLVFEKLANAPLPPDSWFEKSLADHADRRGFLDYDAIMDILENHVEYLHSKFTKNKRVERRTLIDAIDRAEESFADAEMEMKNKNNSTGTSTMVSSFEENIDDVKHIPATAADVNLRAVKTDRG
ncbi:unnamed protein product, partial [Amoebophrya sp. A25]